MHKQTFSLKKLNSFRVEAASHRLTYACWANEFVGAFSRSQIEQKRLLVLGKGANVLFVEDFDGEVVVNNCSGIKLNVYKDANHIHVNSGVEWDYLVQWAIKLGVYGLENMSGIPGTVGGGIVGNIGAYGSELEDFVHHVELIDMRCGDIIKVAKPDCYFSYRDSIFKHDYRDYVITAVELRLPLDWQPNLKYKELANKIAELNKEKVTAQDIRESVLYLRNKKVPNPNQIGNAGSFFTNPIISAEDYVANLDQLKTLLGDYFPKILFNEKENTYKISAAALIEKAGLKGLVHKGAKVSNQHSLVIVNENEQATAQDIVELAAQIQARIKNLCSITLKPEVRFIAKHGEVNATQYLEEVSKQNNYH